jgi:glutathione S-transferase
MATDLPVLYSFRRCPYAMRARMALFYSGISVELREVVLRDMPAALLDCSPKGTVPVLVLEDGTVIEESRDIMHWALAARDPDHWLPPDAAAQRVDIDGLVDSNDRSFKQQLDRYKYADRYPEQPPGEYRHAGEEFLQQLEQRLKTTTWLCGDCMTLADVAIFPFVRQFAFVDKPWFDAAPYPRLQQWLNGLLKSPLFLGVMNKYPPWQDGDAATVFPD